MNAFIKWLAKRIADRNNVVIVDEKVFQQRVADALADMVGANIYMADAKVTGIVRDIEEDEDPE